MQKDIIVIGGSAGALEPLKWIVQRLPKDLRASIFIVIHTSADNPGFLKDILARASLAQVEVPKDSQIIEHHRLYIAPPDFHLTLDGDRIHVKHGPKENGFRPAIDPLFYTAARAFGKRVIGLILSGAMSDGVYGLNVIKQYGGIAIVQHPDEAMVSGLPLNAIQNVEVDHIVSKEMLPELLIRLVNETDSNTERPHMAKQENGVNTAELHPWGTTAGKLNGAPSIFTCPECGGSLWETDEGKVLRFRCHTGHAYSSEALVEQQDALLENALWSATRILRERAVFRYQLSERAKSRGIPHLAQTYHDQGAESESQADAIRNLITENSLRANRTPFPPNTAPNHATIRNKLSQ